jgi:hypothetical protein
MDQADGAHSGSSSSRLFRSEYSLIDHNTATDPSAPSAGGMGVPSGWAGGAVAHPDFLAISIYLGVLRFRVKRHEDGPIVSSVHKPETSRRTPASACAARYSSRIVYSTDAVYSSPLHLIFYRANFFPISRSTISSYFPFNF